MADVSNIAWTDSTANFWMGCFKISPGCAHCYAETLTVNRMGLDVWGPASTSRRQEVKSIWTNLRKWNRDAGRAGVRRRVFVMSLGDFFEPHRDADAIRPRAWDAMRETFWLDFQILTKRPDNIVPNLPADWGDGWTNVWLGTSIESDAYVSRVDELRRVPARTKFISAEPLLGPLPSLNLSGIDWVIVGGESGSGYRPMDHAWAREIRDKCVSSGTAFFMKQSAAPRTEMGTYLIEPDESRWAWKQYPRTPFMPDGDFAQPVLVGTK